MKQFAKHMIATALLSTAVIATPAVAEQKIGIVDVQAIFQAMPQAAEISESINAEFKDQIEEVTQLQRDVQFFSERLQRDAATMSEAEKNELQQKIITAREQYTAKGQPLQQTIQRRSNEERNKLLGLIKQSIDNVAAQGNYDLILNANAASFAKPDLDVSAQVLDSVSKLN
ncbi:OmpH family outer membrane protein [Alteromonas oceanisediminis]|uniref:OmpH family outer membrane protein n=1 Tax=Alteromonas oceanisediminis TaxID=2836180 RepID=UPI001BD9CA46|nr:OmpH family outer membrane protein [Alteromonas oceanisediminis]MBT0585005.1 OmpH family outer membrane protein [Alteromonas oceanisediminis]